MAIVADSRHGSGVLKITKKASFRANNENAWRRPDSGRRVFEAPGQVVAESGNRLGQRAPGQALQFDAAGLQGFIGEGQGDDLQLRAVLETALEVLASPSYRQVLRCTLSLEAARVGDVAAAREWLAPCDAQAYDLAADSAYRHAAAYLATRERQPTSTEEAIR